MQTLKYQAKLEFTPLEFETTLAYRINLDWSILEFTPLEFETWALSWSWLWHCILEFTPLEFETGLILHFYVCREIRIYSVGVWNRKPSQQKSKTQKLEFTPLEFETRFCTWWSRGAIKLEFTPLEFETNSLQIKKRSTKLLEFTPLEFETRHNLKSNCARLY